MCVGLVEINERNDKRAALPKQTADRKCYEEVANFLVTCYEEVTRKQLPWNLALKEQDIT